MISGIYQLRCLPTGDCYIGSSGRVGARLAGHRRTLRLGIHIVEALQRLWTRYGEEVFDFTLLESCAPERLREREQFWLDRALPSLNRARIAGGRRGPVDPNAPKGRVVILAEPQIAFFERETLRRGTTIEVLMTEAIDAYFARQRFHATS